MPKLIQEKLTKVGKNLGTSPSPKLPKGKTVTANTLGLKSAGLPKGKGAMKLKKTKKESSTKKIMGGKVGSVTRKIATKAGKKPSDGMKK